MWLLLVLLAGCFQLDALGDDDAADPPPPPPPDVQIQASWQLQTVGHSPAACPAGIDTAEVTIQPYAVGNCSSVPCPDTLLDAPTVLTGTCASGAVSMTGKAFTSYRVTVRLLAAQTHQVYAISMPQHVQAYSASGADVAVPIYSDGGYLQLSWGFHDDTTNQGLGGCYDPPGSIDVSIDGPTQYAKTYLCTDWYDIIPLAAGSYSIAMTGTPWQGGPVGSAATATAIQIAGPITSLDQITIDEGVIHFSE